MGVSMPGWMANPSWGRGSVGAVLGVPWDQAKLVSGEFRGAWAGGWNTFRRLCQLLRCQVPSLPVCGLVPSVCCLKPPLCTPGAPLVQQQRGSLQARQGLLLGSASAHTSGLANISNGRALPSPAEQCCFLEKRAGIAFLT